MATIQDMVDEISMAALKEGRTFRVIDERTSVATGENFLLIENRSGNPYRVIIDLARFYSSEDADIRIFKNVTVDSQGTEIFPENLATTDLSDEPQFNIYRGGSYSGRITNATNPEFNVVDSIDLESQSGGFLSSIGDEDTGDFAVLGSEGGNMLVVFDNISGGTADKQKSRLRIVQEIP